MQCIILKNAIQCKKCKDIIESKHRHDFKFCSCESVGIDGGKDMLRRVGDMDCIIDLSEITSEDEEDWFEKVRNNFTWRSYGKDGKSPRKDTLLKNLDTDHILAILETQWHIKGTAVEKWFNMELEYRKVQA